MRKLHFISVLSPSPRRKLLFSSVNTLPFYVALIIPTSLVFVKTVIFSLLENLTGMYRGIWHQWHFGDQSLLLNEPSLLTLRLKVRYHSRTLLELQSKQQNVWWEKEGHHQITQTFNICKDSRKTAHYKYCLYYKYITDIQIEEMRIFVWFRHIALIITGLSKILKHLSDKF